MNQTQNRGIFLTKEWEGNSLFDREICLYWLGGTSYGTTEYDSTCTNLDGSRWYGADHDFMEVVHEFDGKTIEEAVSLFQELYKLDGFIQ